MSGGITITEVTETVTAMTATAVTAEIPAATETPAEAGGVTSGLAGAITPETAVTEAPAEVRTAAEMTTAARTATAAGVKTAAALAAVQVRTGGTGCSGRDVRRTVQTS